MITIPEQINLSIKISVGTITLLSDRLLKLEIEGVDEITVQSLYDILAGVKELGNGKSYCNLIVVNEFISIDPKALQFSASEEGNIYTIADAFVINSAALKLIGNFYMKVNKPVKPTRVFNKESDALDWLHSFV